MENITRLESEVRSYSRSFPVLFEKAKDGPDVPGRPLLSIHIIRQIPVRHQNLYLASMKIMSASSTFELGE